MKNIIKFGILAVLSAALIFGCAAPVGFDGDGFNSEPGYGSFRLNLNGTSFSRAIMPDAPTMLALNMQSYRLIFTPWDGTTLGTPLTFNRNASNINSAFTIAPGTYKLVVYAWRLGAESSAGWENRVFAMGTPALNADVVITPTITTSTPVALSVVSPQHTADPSVGPITGEFTWNIQYTGVTAFDLDSATMTVRPIKDTSSSVTTWTRDIMPGANNNGNDLTFPEGIYYLELSIKPETIPNKLGDEVKFRQILYIYRTLRSTFNCTFVLNEFGLEQEDDGYFSGSGITINDVNSRQLFNLDVGGSALAWGETVNISPGTPTATINVGNTTGLSNIRWYLGNDTVGVTGNSFPVNIASAPFNNAFNVHFDGINFRTYRLMVEAEDITNGLPFSTMILIRVAR